MKHQPWEKGFCYEATPVVIRGVQYPSQTSAARALGVPQSAVYQALERGTLDGVGLGRNHHSKLRMMVDGVEFESIADAAREIGMRPDCLVSRRKIRHKKGIKEMEVNGRKLEWD